MGTVSSRLSIGRASGFIVRWTPRAGLKRTVKCTGLTDARPVREENWSLERQRPGTTSAFRRGQFPASCYNGLRRDSRERWGLLATVWGNLAMRSDNVTAYPYLRYSTGKQSSGDSS